MASKLRSHFSSLLCNAWSWRTDRKLVVFESDDWGGIRLPPKSARESLRRNGINLTNSPYNQIDCLESRSDLEGLLNVLASNTDVNGRAPPFTTYNVMANPDFQKIRESDYREYHFEHFLCSYRRYNREDLDLTWKAAITAGLLHPQFHAREHLNTYLWLEDLRNGHNETLTCFKYDFFGNQRSSSPPRFYMAAYWPLSQLHNTHITTAFDNGLEMFRSYFGYNPSNFVACDYVLPRELEQHANYRGIKGIQTQRGYRQPSPADTRDKFVYRRTGWTNRWGTVFTIRNATFEPALAACNDHVDRTMAEIKMAFRFNCPAVISTHRANYASGVEPTNSGRTLRLLSQLLSKIKSTWPTVEFLSSSDLLELVTKEFAGNDGD
jgi:hypothetical protein